jgi:hypothetical protein
MTRVWYVKFVQFSVSLALISAENSHADPSLVLIRSVLLQLLFLT